MEKIIIEFEDIEIQKQKFHQHIRPISIKIININKVVISNKISSGKKDLNILLTTTILEKLDLDLYFSPKQVHIEKTSMKLIICLF